MKFAYDQSERSGGRKKRRGVRRDVDHQKKNRKGIYANTARPMKIPLSGKEKGKKKKKGEMH